MNAKPCRGFTLIELIMVIVLLAVVSVYAASRYVGKSSFDAQLMEEAVLSSLRLTQLRAMNRNGLCGRWIVDGNKAIDMAASITSGACTTTFPANTNDSSFVDANEDGVSLTISSGNFIDFDSLGRPSQCSTNACTVTIQGQSGTSRFICINSEGGIFANPTSC
ncbi:Tfp pilus assembly protein FimT/FimU [Vibrio coralliilyticus]|jgi:MSHA pilin protein MshC|uniref:prepilin-type N-terminal cleavage/methylation domain-containing protein n=1 Tax=Vibrio coralliilyticus TaxID=190893 RepID=UPI0002EB49A3|nr:prepilin-type N-terminal cleavage/methylation domain-containing protein [Vibrio coralliilyticus]NRF65001.1 prepilin-type N-terminal cleavage/methylation domain-containing protein [Vibrio coralliilyticus]